mgnify:CR=1 FL=1
MIFDQHASLRKEKISPEESDPNTKYIGLEHIGEGTLSLNGFGHASDVNSSKAIFKKGDILFGKLRPYFRKVIIVPFDGICSTDIWVVKPKNGIDRNFLFYWMASQDFVDEVTRSSEGTRMPRAKWEVASKIEIPDVEIGKQKKIGEILYTLDQKIHLNQQTNKTLEAMAQAIFKSWFVDFDPVRAKIEATSVGRDPNRAAMAAIAGISLDQALDEVESALNRKLEHMSDAQRTQLRETAELFPDELVESEIGEVPKGWEVKSLDEIADYLNGRAMQKYPSEEGKPTLPVLKIAQLRKGDTEGADIATDDIPERFKVYDGDMIFSWSGSLLIKLWAGGDAALNQHLFKVTSDRYDQWFYYHWTRHHLDNFIRIAESKAVTMGHIKRSHLKEAKCAIPTSELLEFGKQHIEPLLAQGLHLKLESRNLAELRDTLLPKLISGEIGI